MCQKSERGKTVLRYTDAEQETLNLEESNELTKCTLMLLIKELQHIDSKSGKISWHLNKYSQTHSFPISTLQVTE